MAGGNGHSSDLVEGKYVAGLHKVLQPLDHSHHVLVHRDELKDPLNAVGQSTAQIQ